MICEGYIDITDKSAVLKAAQKAAEGFEEKNPAEKQKLVRILEIMLYAHTAARLRDSAKELLSTLQ
jgi:hypothetical protein